MIGLEIKLSSGSRSHLLVIGNDFWHCLVEVDGIGVDVLGSDVLLLIFGFKFDSAENSAASMSSNFLSTSLAWLVASISVKVGAAIWALKRWRLLWLGLLSSYAMALAKINELIWVLSNYKLVDDMFQSRWWEGFHHSFTFFTHFLVESGQLIWSLFISELINYTLQGRHLAGDIFWGFRLSLVFVLSICLAVTVAADISGTGLFCSFNATNSFGFDFFSMLWAGWFIGESSSYLVWSSQCNGQSSPDVVLLLVASIGTKAGVGGWTQATGRPSLVNPGAMCSGLPSLQMSFVFRTV